MATPAIEVSELTKVYGGAWKTQRVVALSGVSFVVNRGEICALIGPNGAGKTTLMHLLMGFHRADSGAIRVLGRAPDDVQGKQQIGFLPESFTFYRYLTAPALMQLHRALLGNAVPAERIPQLLARVGLAGYPKLKIGKYSRGMLQRLGLAQALLGEPQLLILDEPTSGLDPGGRQEVLDLLRSLKGAGGTVLVSSHILPELEQICDRVVIIDRGRLVRAGRLQEIVASELRIEIVASWVTPALEKLAAACAAEVQRGPDGVRITVDPAHRHELTAALLAAGCEVLSITPVRASLQETFLADTGREASA